MSDERRHCPRCGEPFYPCSEFGAWRPSCACVEEEARMRTMNFIFDKLPRLGPPSRRGQR